MKRIMLMMIISLVCFSFKDTRTFYRQASIYKDGTFKPVSGWQEILVTKGDTIYQYQIKRQAVQRRIVIIVFGKEGVKPVSNWVDYVPANNDTVYQYKSNLGY